MYSRAGTSDSGVFYVVKDRRGNERFVKRPKAPPTSPPLASDFDQCTTRAPTDWGARNSWAPTSAPLPEDFDAVTYTAVTAAPIEDEVVDEEDPVASTRRSHSFTSGPSRGSTMPAMYSRSSRGYGPATSNASAMEVGTYGEFGEYTKEMQQVFPSSKGFAVSVSKNSPRHRRTSDPALTPHPGRRRQANWKSKSMGRAGPKAGAEFDVVRDRILEETPEKTTTISTWRQRVADEADDKEEDMSVYYLTPRDYDAQEQEFGERSTSRALSTIQKGKQRSSDFSSQETLGFESKSTFRRQGSVQTLLTEPDERSMSPASKSLPTPWMSTPPKTVDQYPRPRTSSPQSNVVLPRPTRRISRSHTPIRTSTPNKGKESPPPVPFIPTRSGSTISSIKSHATTAFQDILSSCNPSLSHIADPLQSLGINSEAHLRAISSMTEGVRDREVRDEALKKGITVMEWALLLDKIRSL
ncbi:hypothetical protein BDZ89DRAFT_1134203 [Hymenopellis radicata]|nr:hypothetical protein BDZ89DRAFT_1134203 [Hymenopellis radicata]